MPIILFVVLGLFLLFDAKVSLEWLSNQNGPSPTLQTMSGANFGNLQTLAFAANLYFKTHPVNMSGTLQYIDWDPTLKNMDSIPLALRNAKIPNNWYVATANGKWALCVSGINEYSLLKISALVPANGNNKIIKDSNLGMTFIGVGGGESYNDFANLCRR